LNVEFRGSFVRDLKKVREQRTRDRVREIVEFVERASGLQEIGGIRKLRGGEHYYRIRVGDYRIGLLVEGETAVFVRFLHRKDIYRYFP
jgi:mRNA interferase RelE/StbE